MSSIALCRPKLRCERAFLGTRSPPASAPFSGALLFQERFALQPISSFSLSLCRKKLELGSAPVLRPVCQQEVSFLGIYLCILMCEETGAQCRGHDNQATVELNS